MLTNIIFFILGVAASSAFFFIYSKLKNAPVGELQIDSEKEILQVAFYSRRELADTVDNKHYICLRVIRKTLNWNVPQE